MFTTNLILTIAIAVTIASAASVCVDKNALYAVNATVHLNKTSNRLKVGINFYLLDYYAIIDVYQANVTELCEGMVKNFPRLEVLSLINVNLSKLQKGVFENVPNLRELSLAVNHLKKIVKGSFDNLPALEILYLSSNKISYIEEYSFADMPRLKEVHFDRNELADINGNLFMGSPNVALIDFKFNLVQKITKTSFEDLAGTSRPSLTILLNKNQIAEVDGAAFEPLPAVNLHLEGNKLNDLSDLLHMVADGSKLYLNQNLFSCVPEDVLENIRVSNKYLYLMDNPLACDCVDQMESSLGEDFNAMDRFRFKSSFPCEFANQFIA